MFAFRQASLSRQFLLLCFPILLGGMVVIGSLIGRQVEESVVHRIGGVTGLYVDSMISPHVQSLTSSPTLLEADHKALDELLNKTSLGRRIVAFKIWRPDGTILYSADAWVIGKRYPIEEGLREALAGNVHAEISSLAAEENAAEAARFPRLLETYTPIHALGQGSVIAVAEFYQPVDEVMHEVFLAKRQSWLVVAPVIAVMYLLLFLLVRRGSHTIERQQAELNDKVAQLTGLVRQNEALHKRVWRAAASTTELNENFLKRISADLHDGPGQDLSFALMRFQSATGTCGRCGTSQEAAGTAEIHPINAAIDSALKDLRSICAGLRLPDMDDLGITQIAERAIRDYEGKTGAKVRLDADAVQRQASRSVRIALYRLLQESLANGYRHAGAKGQYVAISYDADDVLVSVSDGGPGFDSAAAAQKGRLGLTGMRDRVEMLGGSFDVHSAQNCGTTIQVRLPLIVPEIEHG
ncbi:Signal transduction histidine kinase [Noviherbaspirillum humi]|uniref:histidine kinase n=2 Tax=Noviherbaspirillum humi TaxID=1688639 RepID=A0A239IFU6_9BURK|nr:Signal transduction histidine kinase [Noviherbaspirillum humi]